MRPIDRTFGWLALALLAAGAARADPVVWRVAGDHGSLWLLGSVHYLRDADYPLPGVVDELYERADRIVMEIDLDDIDAARLQSALVGAAMLPGDATLAGLLDDDVYSLAERRADDLGFDLDALSGFEPWLVALTLMDLGMARQGFRSDRGLEQYLLGRAAADGKPISGLESVEAQVGVFESLSAEEQQALLEQTLTELEDAEAVTNEMIDAWREGRFDELGKELLGDFDSYPHLYDTLVVDRNRNWIEPLMHELERPGDALVVVGALHLVGPDSVIGLLRERGIAVERPAERER